VDLPRMSKHLRSLMRDIAASLTGDGSTPLIDEGLRIEIDHDTIQWYGGQGAENERPKGSRPKGFGNTEPKPTGTKRLAQSKMQAALRSLYSNEAGAVWIRGLDSVSWSMDGNEVAQRLREKGLIGPTGEVRRGEEPRRENTEADGPRGRGKNEVQVTEDVNKTAFRIERRGIQKEWARGIRRVIRGSRETEIRLSVAGKEMLRDIWAWEEAKAAGVPLTAAQSNEQLPEEYLSPSQLHDPGRHRTRSLYQEEVEGTRYFSNGSLIVRGIPPVMEEKHQPTDRIGKSLEAIEVERGTLFAEKNLPTTYVEQRSSSGYSPGPSRYIILANGMCVSVRSCLFVHKRFPNGIWTTALYDAVHEPPSWKSGAEAKRVRERYPVVVGPENEILALIPTFDPPG